MIYRIVFLPFCTLFFFMMMIVPFLLGDPIFLMPFSFFCLSSYITWRTIWVHARFKLASDQIVVKQPFRNAFSVDLKQLTNWSEHSYNIRGQRRKTVELFFSENRKIKLTNHDLKDEFESLYLVLTGKYREYENLNMTLQEKHLYDDINNVLLTEWNPLGINNNDDVKDKYEDYALQVFNLKKNAADLEAIAGKLFEIETKSLGLFGNMNHCRHIAEKVMALSYRN